MTQAVYLTMDYEDLSYHIVPSTPKNRQAVVCTSPAAIVPDLDTINCRQPIFVILNTSPHPSSSTNRVPSVSPKTPVVTRNTRREQLVPSRSPFARTTPVTSTIENITSNRGTCLEAIHLFSDDENIFL